MGIGLETWLHIRWNIVPEFGRMLFIDGPVRSPPMFFFSMHKQYKCCHVWINDSDVAELEFSRGAKSHVRRHRSQSPYTELKVYVYYYICLLYYFSNRMAGRNVWIQIKTVLNRRRVGIHASPGVQTAPSLAEHIFSSAFKLNVNATR